MSNTIIEHIGDPEALEELYQHSPDEFKVLLKQALKHEATSETLHAWKARISYEEKNIKSSSRSSLYFILFLSLLAGLAIKIPYFSNIPGDWYYTRFSGFVVITPIILYFLIKSTGFKTVKYIVGGITLSAIYMSILPKNTNSASINMALIHMPLLLLSLLALSFMGEEWRNIKTRINFIRYIGEIIIYSTLFLLGGIVLTAITFGLFSLIGLAIEHWYMEYIVVWGIVSAPLVATYLYNDVLRQKSSLATTLSNVFSPLFLITIIAYLIAAVYQGKSPFSDREFLITFNGLLLVIWGITVFSISGRTKTSKTYLSDTINITLLKITLLINTVALSAIIFRWAEYGITPNRVAVTGANILVFVHLMLLLWQYTQFIKFKKDFNILESTIAKFLPLYSIWSLCVVLLLPILFQYR